MYFIAGGGVLLKGYSYSVTSAPGTCVTTSPFPATGWQGGSNVLGIPL